jgi:hypothetical protein
VSKLELLFWHLIDWLDYQFWDVRLRLVDAVYGFEPETERPRSDWEDPAR